MYLKFHSNLPAANELKWPIPGPGPNELKDHMRHQSLLGHENIACMIDFCDLISQFHVKNCCQGPQYLIVMKWDYDKSVLHLIYLYINQVFITFLIKFRLILMWLWSRCDYDHADSPSGVAWNSQGWGVTKPISFAHSFPNFSESIKYCKLLNIMFIFDRCHHSGAVLMPVKYEHD